MAKFNARATGERAELNALRDDPMIRGLRQKSPAEVYRWVDDNVNDLGTAKDVLKRLSAAVAYLLKQVD